MLHRNKLNVFFFCENALIWILGGVFLYSLIYCVYKCINLLKNKKKWSSFRRCMIDFNKNI